MSINGYKVNRDVNETRQSRVSIFFLDPLKGISQLPSSIVHLMSKFGAVSF